ncbi:FAD-dependent oxidoreductase [Arthrobacter sp. ok362]|uniref:FAD-dependent oxidoreductase n=1 Tax=Arthrobacter sp. ok362 TaxID=1761745 RepID=UPI00087F6F73|nr:FAD-dependent oxidoreductase [Arthrobacter sp. ok362]SDL23597.1 Glycine/D-amino acid oxidase [Arthrobacter sp. ok362]
MGERLEGRQVSLWVATAGATRYPSLDSDLEVDVAVVGGGIAGLTAALALKRAGHTVAVLEAARVGTGVTGHTTGKVTSLHRLVYTELADRHGPDVAGMYGEANQAAIGHIARTVAEEGIDCDFRRVSNYTYAESDDALARVRAEAAVAAQLGLPSVFASDVPLPFAVRGAVRFDAQAQLHAVKYLQGLARAVDGDGSHVLEDSRVTSVRDGVPGVVETGRGTVRAREVIVATNVPVGDGGLFAERCYLHRSYIVACLAPAAPLDGTFISVDEPMRSILAIDVDGSRYVLTGGEGHRAAETGDAAVRYRRLAAFSRERLGTGETSFRWSTQDTMPVDGLPYAGPLTPTAAHLHVITGLRKWGLTNGTAAALILADTLAGIHNPWAAVFDPNRTSATGQAGGRSPRPDRAPQPQQPEQRTVAGLRPGEGTVVEIDGEMTAVYADPAGGLLAVSAICTHLGCTVAFNADDSTWDCPCHGSRFAADGAVIQGPATVNLAPRPAPSRAAGAVAGPPRSPANSPPG